MVIKDIIDTEGCIYAAFQTQSDEGILIGRMLHNR